MATASLPPGPPDSDDDVSAIDRVVEQIDTLRPLAFNLAFRLLRRTEDAADAVQDASILAVRAARGTTATPREPAFFKPWFLKIVTNVALGQLRRKRPGGSVSLDEIEGDLPDSHAEQPLSVVERREQRGDVLAALLALPDAQRAALTLREYQGLTYDEIGETLGLNRGSTTALLYRARTTFRAAYGGVAARRKPVGCVKLAPLISAMLDDELGAATWTRVESHLATCPRCTRELRMLRRSQHLHAIVPLLAPPSAWTTASHLGAVGAQRTAEIIDLTTRAPAATGLLDRAAEVGRPLAASALLGATALLPGGAPGNVASLVERGLGRLAAAVTAAGLLLVVASGAPAPGHDGSASAAPGIDQQVGSASRSEVTGDTGTAFGFAPSSAANVGPTADDTTTTSMAATAFTAAPASTVQATDPPAPVIAQAVPAASEVDERAAPEIEASETGSIVQEAVSSAAPPVTVARAPGLGNEGHTQGSEPPAPSGGAATGDPPANPPAGGASSGPGSAGAPASGQAGSSGSTTAQTPPPDPPGGGSPPIDLPPIDPPGIDVPPIDLAVAGLPPLDLPAVELPAVDLPPIDLPTIAEGEISVPPVDLPPVDVPAVDVPPVSLPVAGLPPVDVPPIDVPAIDLPAVEVPAVQVPLAEIPLVEGTLDRTQGVVGEAVQQAGQTVQGVGQAIQQDGESTVPLDSLADNVHGTLESTGSKSIDSTAAVSVGGGGQPAASLDASATLGAPAANGTASVDPAASVSAGVSTGQPNSGASASVQAGAESHSVVTSVNTSTGVGETTMSIEAGPTGTGSANGLTMTVNSGAPSQSTSEHGSPSTATVTVNAGPDSGGSSTDSSSSSTTTSVSASVDTGAAGSGNTDTSSATSVSASIDTGSGSSGTSDSSGSTSVSASIDTGSSSAGSSDSSNSSSTSISVSVDTGSSSSGNSDNNSTSTSISVSIDTGSSGSGNSDNNSSNSVGVSVGGVSVGVSLP